MLKHQLNEHSLRYTRLSPAGLRHCKSVLMSTEYQYRQLYSKFHLQGLDTRQNIC